MSKKLITYDLRAPGQDYKPLWAYLAKIGAVRGLESVWVVDNEVGTGALRDSLGALVDSNDRVLVIETVKNKWSSRHMLQAAVDLLNS